MEFYYGMVEDRNDPLKVGRVRVRVHGVHGPLLRRLLGARQRLGNRF